MLPNKIETIVIDTNVVLDLLVFNDPQVVELKQQLLQGKLKWLVTPPMRIELQRVLGYSIIAQRLLSEQLTEDCILRQFDELTTVVNSAATSAYICKDKDDQKFIDLSVEQRSFLLSKDKAVLATGKKLKKIGILVKNKFD